MSVRLQKGQSPAPMEVEGQGVTFSRAWRGDAVEVCVEYPDLSGWSSGAPRTDERWISISREDWDAIVAHVEGEGEPD